MNQLNGIILIAVACVMGTVRTPAQPPSADLPGPPPKNAPEGDMPRSGRNRSVERWLQFLERERPDEFAEMSRLREENPEAFQQRLRSRRDRLRVESLESALVAVPRCSEFLEGMSPEERKDIIGQLDRKLVTHLDRSIASQLGRGGGGERRGSGPRRQRGNPEVRELHQEIDALAVAYREAERAQQKAIEEELRGKLETAFDLAESNRQEHIRRAEERLGSLKEDLRARAESREDIIAQRLKELTGTGPDRPKE